MTVVDRQRVNIPDGVEPRLRETLRHILRALDGIRERTGGPTDKLAYITVTQAVNLDTIESDIASVKTKTDFITVTQAVDLDTVESSVTTLQGRTLTAGSGLTGGGDLSADRTFNIGAGTGITVAADAISTNDSAIVHDSLSGFVANEHIDHSGVTLTAGNGLTGGGDITTNRSFAIDTAVVIDKSAISTYTPSNDATDRTWDANAAAGAISSTPTQAEVENIRDAVLELSDVVATLATDLGLT